MSELRSLHGDLRRHAGRSSGECRATLRADLAGDLGCLMNMAGKLQREGSPVKARHVAEILAGMADGPAIGESQKGRER